MAVWRLCGASRSVSGISSGLRVPGEDSAGRDRHSWVWQALAEGLEALRDFVNPIGDLGMVRGVLLDSLEALEALEALRGDERVATMMTECLTLWIDWLMG